MRKPPPGVARARDPGPGRVQVSRQMLYALAAASAAIALGLVPLLATSDFVTDQAFWIRMRRRYRSPLRVRPLCRLPALSHWPGHKPAQLAACAASGNRLMSVPSSAISVHAVVSCTPGIVHSRAMAAACGFMRSRSR